MLPKMTIAWLGIYATLLIASFVNPLYGTLGYMFEYYLRPRLHWWGKELPDLRWNLMISVVLSATYLANRSSMPDIGKPRRTPGACLVALLLVMLMVYPIAANQESSWRKTVEYSKMILFHGLLVGTVRTELAFDAVAAMHIAGAGWWGWEAWRNPKRTAGRLSNVGSGDTRGDNGTAAHLLTVLPFIAVYLAVHTDRRLRLLALFAGPLVLNTIILCNSRGATVAMAAMVLVALTLAKRGHRIRMVGAGIAVAFSMYMLADPQFLERQKVTSEYGKDGSSTGRLQAWKGALKLIEENPLGTGGQGFYELSPIYAAELVEEMGAKRDPHNTVVLVASEWGILGLTLYLAYYTSVFKLLRDVRKHAKEGIWYYRSVAINLGLVGIFVAGLFTDRLYAEGPYWMGAFAVVLHRLYTHKVREESKQLASVTDSTAATVADRVQALPQAV